jgi:hypothetical protein
MCRLRKQAPQLAKRLAARRIAGTHLRNLGLLSLDLLHIDAILLRSRLRPLTILFICPAGLRISMIIMM